jgi:hypothetical protein
LVIREKQNLVNLDLPQGALNLLSRGTASGDGTDQGLSFGSLRRAKTLTAVMDDGGVGLIRCDPPTGPFRGNGLEGVDGDFGAIDFLVNPHESFDERHMS